MPAPSARSSIMGTVARPRRATTSPKNTAPSTAGRSNVWSKDRDALLAFASATNTEFHETFASNSVQIKLQCVLQTSPVAVTQHGSAVVDRCDESALITVEIDGVTRTQRQERGLLGLANSL